MNIGISIDDLVVDLAIHFEVEPLSYGEGWSLDDEDNKQSANEARRIVKRWLVNKGLIEPEDM